MSTLSAAATSFRSWIIVHNLVTCRPGQMGSVKWLKAAVGLCNGWAQKLTCRLGGRSLPPGRTFSCLRYLVKKACSWVTSFCSVATISSVMALMKVSIAAAQWATVSSRHISASLQADVEARPFAVGALIKGLATLRCCGSRSATLLPGLIRVSRAAFPGVLLDFLQPEPAFGSCTVAEMRAAACLL